MNGPGAGDQSVGDQSVGDQSVGDPAEARPVGWHAHETRFRFWDGERWAFSATARDLRRYRSQGTRVAGVDFRAPTFGTPRTTSDDAGGRRFILGSLAFAAVVILVVLLAFSL